MSSPWQEVPDRYPLHNSKILCSTTSLWNEGYEDRQTVVLMLHKTEQHSVRGEVWWRIMETNIWLCAWIICQSEPDSSSLNRWDSNCKRMYRWRDVVYGNHAMNDRTRQNVMLADMEEVLYIAEGSWINVTKYCSYLPKKFWLPLWLIWKEKNWVHACHIYSLWTIRIKLPVDSVRSLLGDILRNCDEKNIDVPVISFDGQFHKIAVSDHNGKPLTLVQLQK